MKLIEILSFNPEIGQYEHYTVTTSKSEKKIVDKNDNLTDDFYDFVIKNFPVLGNRHRQHTKALIRNLSDFVKY